LAGFWATARAAARGGGLLRAPVGARGGLGGGRLRGLLLFRGIGDGEAHFAGTPQHFEDGGLEQPHVVGFDPELINIIGHPQRNLRFVGSQKLDRFEPTLERIAAHLRTDGVGNMLPDQGEMVFHK
jgi:hypothetical protein